MITFIEGPDNVGKGTQIDRIYKRLAAMDRLPLWLHCSNFGLSDKSECINYSMRAYAKMFESCARLHKCGNDVIFDRSHIGEWVYGKIYRDYDAHYIWRLERDCSEFFGYPWHETKLLVFVDTPENLVGRDDGLSYSTDLKKKQFEIDRFKDAYGRSIIPRKRLINIKDRDADDVWAEVDKFLFP